MTEFPVQTTTVDQQTVCYVDVHPDCKPTILFLHGFRGNHRGLVGTAEALDGFRVIIPDLPGYGNSAPFPGRHDFPAYADWVLRFAEQLGISTGILAGHSYGATMALATAAQSQARFSQLVLIEPVVNVSTPTSRLGQLYYRIGSWLPRPLAKIWIVNRPLNRLTAELLTNTRDRQLRRKIIADEQENLRYVDLRVELESFLAFYDFDTTALGLSVHIPTLLIAGGRDSMVTPKIVEKLAASITPSTTTVLPAAGHFLPMEDPRQLADAIRHWLQSTSATAL